MGKNALSAICHLLSWLPYFQVSLDPEREPRLTTFITASVYCGEDGETESNRWTEQNHKELMKNVFITIYLLKQEDKLSVLDQIHLVKVSSGVLERTWQQNLFCKAASSGPPLI